MWASEIDHIGSSIRLKVKKDALKRNETTFAFFGKLDYKLRRNWDYSENIRNRFWFENRTIRK